MRTLAFIAALAAASPAFAADITGVWATSSDNGRVHISPCGTGVCGRLVDADQIRANPNQTDDYNKDKARRSRKVKNLLLFSGYAGGPSEWKGGEIYDPKTGDTGRSGKLKLVSDNRLEVKGCLGPICRTQHWTRTK
jgi:uncharacterized protein (DUF2147 family)